MGKVRIIRRKLETAEGPTRQAATRRQIGRQLFERDSQGRKGRLRVPHFISAFPTNPEGDRYRLRNTASNWGTRPPAKGKRRPRAGHQASCRDPEGTHWIGREKIRRQGKSAGAAEEADWRRRPRVSALTSLHFRRSHRWDPSTASRPGSTWQGKFCTSLPWAQLSGLGVLGRPSIHTLIVTIVHGYSQRLDDICSKR